MKKFPSTVRVTLVALLAGVTVFAGLPANAATGDVVEVDGGGRISPGLPSPGGDTWYFDGWGEDNFVSAGDTGDQLACHFQFDDTIGALDVSAGQISGGCWDIWCSIDIVGTFTRDIAEVTLGGTAGARGGCLPDGSTFSGHCTFVPQPTVGTTSVEPFEGYRMNCVLTF